MYERMRNIYHKKQFQMWESIFFATILLLFPLLFIRYGIDYSDTGYSISNFRFFGTNMGKIQLATYLANAVGFLFMKLPAGGTYLGIVTYTSLFVGCLAVLNYFLLSKYFAKEFVFAGIFMALCVRWCPSVVLYNYLSYFLCTLAIVFIIRGLEENTKKALFLAGIFLGLNIFVRVPNVIQCILILPVILYGIWEKKSGRDIVKSVLACVLGWLSAVCAVFIFISACYGKDAYFDMLRGLLAGTGTDSSYNLLQMLLCNFIEIWNYRKQVLLIGMYLLIGIVAYKLCKYKWLKILYFCLYGIGFLFIIKYFHYWSVFTIRDYTSYNAIRFWMIFWMLISWIVSIIGCLSKRYGSTVRTLCVMCMCFLAIGPIGSNTGILASINNMYFILPFTMGMFVLEMSECKSKWSIKKLNLSLKPIEMIVLLITAITAFQALMFSVKYVYGDMGLNREMNVKVEENRMLKGIYVSAGNAYLIEDITAYVEESDLMGRECITYGNIPIIPFALEMPPALSSPWPDLETYTYEDMQKDLSQIDRPVIIMNKYFSYSIFDSAVWEVLPKTKLLADYMNENSYAISYENDKFAIYLPQ